MTTDTTEQQYFAIIKKCRALFDKKNQDYGTSWKIFRLPSLNDQIYIKAKRIRTIEETKVNKVGDSVESEFIGIINYSLMALMLIENQDNPEFEVNDAYEKQVHKCFQIMQNKNHDYGEAWREMRVSSFTDLILVKLHRIKQIEDSDGVLLASEGVENNYVDCVNYAIFALIQLSENS